MLKPYIKPRVAPFTVQEFEGELPQLRVRYPVASYLKFSKKSKGAAAGTSVFCGSCT